MSYITEINLQRVRQKLDNRKKLPIKKYSAQKAFYTSLYDLILSYGQPTLFVREVTDESIQEPIASSLSEQASQGLVKVYQFIKGNDQKINYFSVAKDINAATAADTCLLFNLLKVYFNLLDNKSLDPEDITIIPLVQIKNARNHFNTIVIQNQKVYLIEPRQNDRQLLFDYPIQKHIKDFFAQFKEIREPFELFQLYTAQQNDFNDSECGAHHVNYVSALADMDQLETSEKILIQLRKTQLKLRIDDAAKEEVLKKVLQPILSTHSSDLDNDQNTIEDDFANIKVSANDDTQAILSLNDLVKQLAPTIKSSQIKKEHFLVTDTNTAMEIATKSQALDKRKLGAAIALLKHKYFIKRKSEFFYHLRHTRDNTVHFLLNFLKHHVNNNEDAAAFLFSCYDALKDKNGRLSFALEQAIALLIDIDLYDIRDIQKRKWGWQDKRNYLFKNLAEKARANENYLIEQTRWQQIDSIETSFFYRANGNKQNNKDLAMLHNQFSL